MRLVLDTNVLVSGLFFSGPPHEVLDAWRGGKVQLVVSSEILEEYFRVAEDLSSNHSGIDYQSFLDLLSMRSMFVVAPSLTEEVCEDPDDDKFLACALASRTRTICSGDKALLRASGYKGVAVLTPRQLVDRHLKE